MMRTTKEQLTMVSVVAASRLPSRTLGKATKESHSSFQVVLNNSTGSSVTGYRSPSSASSDMAVRRHSVIPSYSGIVCAVDARGHFTKASPAPISRVVRSACRPRGHPHRPAGGRGRPPPARAEGGGGGARGGGGGGGGGGKGGWVGGGRRARRSQLSRYGAWKSSPK